VDGSGEYKSHLLPIFTSLGNKDEPTPTCTPECNGKTKLMNRTLNTMVHAMITQANMPKSFWADAMKTAMYVRN
jgi:hypothetical protein